MKLEFAHTHKDVVSVLLLAVAIGFAAQAQASEVKLFPINHASSDTQLSEAPAALPALSSVEPLPMSAPPPANAQVAPAPGGPLRVVIPNIHHKQEPKLAKDKVVVPSPAQREAAALRQLSQSLYAQSQDEQSNGVMIADWSNTPIIRTMLKPNMAFAMLPSNWQVGAGDKEDNQVLLAENIPMDAHVIATLSPASGVAEAINMEPSPPTVQASAAAPRAPVSDAPIVNQVNAVDASEPAPSLSSQSQAIIGKIPPVTDAKPEPPLAQKVDVAHAKKTHVLTGESAAKPREVSGVKAGAVRRTQMDVNYELERAYNALIAGHSETAIQIYEDILTGAPKNKEALFGLASTYHRLGQIDIARTLYGKLLAIEPKHRDGLNNFLVLLADEAPQEALTQMERLEAQNPGFSPIPAQMAIIYQKLGDQDKAVDKMYRALAIAPENITYRYNLAIMLDKSGKYAEAGKLYGQLLDSYAKGSVIPGDATKIQQRLTFIRSNTTR